MGVVYHDDEIGWYKTFVISLVFIFMLIIFVVNNLINSNLSKKKKINLFYFIKSTILVHPQHTSLFY